MPLKAGSRLGQYEILGMIGAGGMGEVYRARHLKLARPVAIKVLPADVAGDRARLARFEREARTASALNDANIVTIYDIAEHEGTTYIAMELVEGATIRELIAEADGPLPIDRSVRIAEQVARALAKAHGAGILHRDIKPANVIVTRDEIAKVLDFGLAKPQLGGGLRDATAAATLETREGMIVGTPHYMSPEQISGGATDPRSDQYALGVVLYEMLAGKPPFDGPSVQSLMTAVITAPIPSLRRARRDVPAALERIVRRSLQKDPAARFPDMGQLAEALRRFLSQRDRADRALAMVRRPTIAAAGVALLLAVSAAGWTWIRDSDRRWAERDALIEIGELTDEGSVFAAYLTAMRAIRFAPDNPSLERLLGRITLPASVVTEPAGAEVFVKDYATPDAEWERLGVTPLSLRIPYALMRWRIASVGHEPFEGAPFSSGTLEALARGIRLDSLGRLPPGMVRIPATTLGSLPAVYLAAAGPPRRVETFFIDRHEVTNRQYREFVDAGGYDRDRWWPASIARAGRQTPSRDVRRLFVDRTGRPGPGTWEAGSFPPGEDDHPVGGISWYEAAAYCAFAGKSLPTIYHWFAAVGQEQLSDILLHSNIDGKAKAPVGRFRGLGAFGTYDMAGNVKEWVSTAALDGRYVLGGAWNEPSYLFTFPSAQDATTREPTNGVRCASYPEQPAAPLLAPAPPRSGYVRPPPISDEVFRLLSGMYDYEKTPLEGRVERTNDSIPAYRREIVSIRTAYGEGRMEVHLLIPRDVRPPWQSVIWFPGGDVFLRRSSEQLSTEYLFDFIPRSGRVLVHPIYKGMYERFEPPARTPAELREIMIRWSQDLKRTVDYLETRPDFDARRIGFYGVSWGASIAAVLTAVEPRLGASILLAGGLIPREFRPESNPATFAPHVRVPTLMINGRDDFMHPYELSQKPLFDALGAPADKKRHARLTGGHLPTHRVEVAREVLDWLDRQLGPVRRDSTARADATR